jgi:hypothetical protein
MFPNRARRSALLQTTPSRANGGFGQSAVDMKFAVSVRAALR